jgi:hypothetical protein
VLIMPGNRGFSLYRGFCLYLPLETELARTASGGYCVYAAISRFASANVDLVPIPDCIAIDLEQAMHLSMRHAMRLAEEGWSPSTDEAAIAQDHLKAA